MGMMSAHSAGASSGHRRWYGPKPLTTMVRPTPVTSCNTDQKYETKKDVWYFSTYVKQNNSGRCSCCSTRSKLVGYHMYNIRYTSGLSYWTLISNAACHSLQSPQTRPKAEAWSQAISSKVARSSESTTTGERGIVANSTLGPRQA